MKPGIKAMLFQPWFIAALTLALGHQILQKIIGLSIPLVDSYLDPLLFLPILLHLLLLERRYLFGNGPEYVLSWSHIFAVVFLVSIISELVFSAVKPSFTADYLDVVCYLVGGLFFGVLLNT